MKEYTTNKLRNIALVGHQSSGKTSLVEALLYNTGATNRMGRVEEGNTVSDWEEEEKSRGLSLSTSLIPIEFQDYKINILDTPGFTDFQGDMKNAIRVADSVIVVIDAVHGVEVGTELVWEYAQQFNQPIIVVINKMDRENADFEGTMAQLRELYAEYKFVPVMLPIGSEADFKGVVNVMTQKAYYDAGNERSDLPENKVDIAEEAHTALVEAAAEADDELIEKYFEEGTLSNDEIRDGMRIAARSHELHTVPVFVTSATQNIGTIPLLEALIVYCSSPARRRLGVLREGNDEMEYFMPPQTNDKPLAAYVFKTSTDKYVGTLNYFRIFTGTISNDSHNINATTGQKERFNNLMTMCGKEQVTIKRLHAGDIGVVAKLQDTNTGHTIIDSNEVFQIAKPDFPEPLYMVGVLPKTQADSAKMGTTLTALCDADPTLRWRQDADTKQVVLEGMGEIHIQVTIQRAEALGVGIEIEMPRVPYRETITRQAEATYRHKKQTGGAGQFGEVSLRVMPEPDEQFVYETNIFGGAISHQFLPSIEKGIRQLLEEGVIAGFPLENVKAEVFDGKEHPVDSKDIAFQIAGREAFKIAFRDAGPVLMEPIYTAQIMVPATMMGDIMGDLTTRRGRVLGMDTVAGRTVINAEVPLAEMLRYGNNLRSMTGGRGIYKMSFNRYDRVPPHVQEDIVNAHKTELVES